MTPPRHRPGRAGLPAAALLAIAAALIPAAPPAAEPPAPAAPPAGLERVPADAAAFVTVRVADLFAGDAARGLGVPQLLDSIPAVRQLRKVAGFSPADLERVTLVVPAHQTRGINAAYLLVTTVRPYDRAGLLKELRAKPAQGRSGGPSANYFFADLIRGGDPLALLDDRTVMIGLDPQKKADGERRLGAMLGELVRPRGDGPLAGPLAEAAGAAVFAAGVNLPAFAEWVPDSEVWREPGVRVLSRAATASVRLDLGPAPSLRWRLHFDGPAAAARAESALPADLTRLLDRFTAQAGEEAAALQALRALAADLPVRRDGADLSGTVAVQADPAKLRALAGAFERVARLADRRRLLENLKQVALAMHNFESTIGHLPPAASCDPQGKPLLSWRVAILPYIEENSLYMQFKLDEPWDSEANKKLLEQLPPLYAIPRPEAVGPGLTRIQVFTGKDALFDGGKKARLAAIADGTSNTIMVAEVSEPVPWTKPQDAPFDAKGPLPPLPEEFAVAMCDGSTRLVNRKKVKEQTLRWAIMPADGMVLGEDWNK
jgi:hypothetical protein